MKTNKAFIYAIVYILLCLGILPFMQSCSSEDEPRISQSQQMEYLDVDVSNLQNLTAEEQAILERAKERLNYYIAYQNNAYSLNVQKASDVNMSERLFEHEKTVIEKTNSIIKNLDVVTDIHDNRILHIVNKNGINNSSARLKSSSAEGGIQSGKCGIEYNWYGADIYLTPDVCSTISNLCYAGAGVTEIASGICTAMGISAPAAAVLTICAGAACLGGAGFAQLAKDCSNGCIITITPIPLVPPVIRKR